MSKVIARELCSTSCALTNVSEQGSNDYIQRNGQSRLSLAAMHEMGAQMMLLLQ